MKKQILRKPMAILLILIMVLSMIPTVSLAENEVEAQVNSITRKTDGAETPFTTIDLSAATENISIKSGGDYILTGSTTVYNVSIDTTNAENKVVNLTLDGANIQIPDNYDKKDESALSITGDATVNMIVKEGTSNTLSNVCTRGGIGVTVTANSTLNITDTGTLNISGTAYSLYEKASSSVSIHDATVNVCTSMNGTWVNCIELDASALTINSGSLNATIPEKNSPSSMATSATVFLYNSASSFTQNGGSVKVVNRANMTKNCHGIYAKGKVAIKGGSLFTYGQTNGVNLNVGSTMSIDDKAVFLAASGNASNFSRSLSAVGFSGTGKLEATNDNDKGLVLLKLDSSKPIPAKTKIALKHKITGGFSEEIAETLPMDAYFVAFSAKLGDKYSLTAGDGYVATEEKGLRDTVYTLGRFVAQPKSVNALVEPLPASFTISMPKDKKILKVNSSIKLDISPSYKANWSSDNPSVATIDDAGVVKALSAGTAKITAECQGVTGTYELKTAAMSNPRQFTLKVDNPDVKVVISDGTFTYNPTSINNGVFSYELEDGKYTYVVSKEGFPNKEGEFTISESGSNNVSLSMYYSVVFNLMAGTGVSSINDASITVNDSKNVPVSGIDKKYDNLNGKYTYTVTCDGCYAASGSFDSYGTINVTLNKDRSGAKEADWSGAFNHNYSNAATNAMLPTSADKAYQKWATMVGTDNFGAAYAGTSVIADDYLYITGNGHLNKIDTQNGKIVAQVEAGTTGYIYDYLAYGDGMIFLSGTSYISAYDAETLTLLWRTSVDGQHSTQVNGSMNSKGTIGKFRPIVYSNGYIFCGKNAFKTTSFEVDQNGYNVPVWSINDDFNWNTGAIVGDYYYVAAVQTMYAVNYKTGEIVDSWKFSSDDKVYTWGGVTYSPETERLYWASYSGAKFYTTKINTQTGKILTSWGIDNRYTVDVSQESVCTPVVFKGRVYLVGQKGNVDVLNAVPTSQNYKWSLETIYTVETPERTKIQSTPILCTSYATEENNNTVYLYFQGYTKPSPIYVLRDSGEVKSDKDADIALVAAPTKSQYAFEQIAIDKKGSLYFFNESGYLFCFEKLDYVNTDSVEALINALPSAKNVTSESEAQIKNARKAYNALTEDQKTKINSQVLKKIKDAEAALADLEKPSQDVDKNITVYFTLLGTEKDGENGTINTLKRGNLTTWIERQSVTIKSGSTVGDVFSKVLDDKKYRYEGLKGNYIKNITNPSGLKLGEFDNGKLSGWMYTVNGKHPNLALNDFKLSNGDKIIWHYTDDYTEEEGSEKWGHKAYTPKDEKSGNAKISIDTTAKTDNSGKAKAVVTAKDLKSALDKALEAVKKAEKDGKKNVKPEISLDVKTDSKASVVETTLPLSSVEELTKAEAALTVNSAIGNIILDNKTLKEIPKTAKGKEISFQIARIDRKSSNINKITEAQRKAAGENPVYEVCILSGDKEIKSFGGKNLSISLPYSLKAGESVANVFVWYLDDQGQLTKLTSKYDEKAKLVTFEINHLSCFVVGSGIGADSSGNNTFNDVQKGQWYYDSITYLVQRGIVSGTTKTTFSPNANITRAEFVQILYGMAKSQAEVSGSAIKAGTVTVDGSKAAKTFSDIKNTDWYANAVEWAYESGVAKGIQSDKNGTIKFMPNAKITRQDMAVMIQSYIQKVEKKNITGINGSISFADDAAIASYAKDSVTMMQKGGIINGIKMDDGSFRFAPKSNATRAEAAVMISKYLKTI